MGDRANVKIIDGLNPPVFLYTHWSGSELPEVVRQALARRQRWDDAPYLTRIIFCEMVKGHEAYETGFGISGSICDNEHPIMVVDVPRQQVRLESEEGEPQPDTRPLSFDDFVKLATGDYTSFDVPR